MSYILDALRRADAERERGHVPGIHAQPTRISPKVAGPGRRTVPVRWLWSAAAVPLLLLLGWLSWRASSSGPVAPARGEPASISTAEPTPPPSSSGAVVASEKPVRAPPPASGQTSQSSQSSQTSAARSLAARKPALAARANTVAAASVPASAVPAGDSASAAARIYAYDELPEDVRRELPKLAIGGSSYSESRVSRFVIVNGQLFREGDTLGPGLVLQQIRLKSAVLGFRGYRYGIRF